MWPQSYIESTYIITILFHYTYKCWKAPHRDDSRRRVDVVWRYGTSEVVAWTQILLCRLRRKHRRVVSDVIDNDTARVGGVGVGQQDAIRYLSDSGESLLAPRVRDVVRQLSFTARSREMWKWRHVPASLVIIITIINVVITILIK